MLMYIFAVNFRKWGLPYLPTVGMFDPQVGRRWPANSAYGPAGHHIGNHQHCRL